MKLTNSLSHIKRFWWGKGWGTPNRKNTDSFYYRKQMEAKRKRPLDIVKQTLPENVQPLDPNVYLKQQLDLEIVGEPKDFTLPWPYSARPIKGTQKDPDYRETPALVYTRNKRVLEPIKLPLNVANAVLEPGLPKCVQRERSNIQLDSKFIDHCKQRINWCLHNDAAMRKLPLNKIFPYMDQEPPRVWGVTMNRKESNLLQTLYDLSSQWIATNQGLNASVLTQRVSNPYCVVPLERDGQSIVMDLECDFVTLLTRIQGESSANSTPFDGGYSSSTANRKLDSIYPISWQVAFDEKHFYPVDYEFKIPTNSSIQTIFLSNNNVRLLKDEDLQGRSIMFNYGYALSQAKLRPSSQPRCIQCVYTNPANWNVGYVLFQLNTGAESGGDQTSSVRNQVWLGQPNSLLENIDNVMADLIAIQLRSLSLN